MKKSALSPDEHLAAIEGPRRDDMINLDQVIAKILRGWSRDLWTGTFWGGTDQEIIGYGDYTYNKGAEVAQWFVVGLAQQKNHLSIYVNATDEGRYVGQVFGSRLGKVKLGAASIGFKSIADLDLDVLHEMLERVKVLNPGGLE